MNRAVYARSKLQLLVILLSCLTIAACVDPGESETKDDPNGESRLVGSEDEGDEGISTSQHAIGPPSPTIYACRTGQLRECRYLRGKQFLKLSQLHWSDGQTMNNSIGSFRISPRWEATFCKNTHFASQCLTRPANQPGGYYWSLQAGDAYNKSFNHTISSIEIRAARTPLFAAHNYETTYPGNSSNAWSEEAQGVTHDHSHWYLSNRWNIRKFHYTQSLNSNSPLQIVGLPGDGCNHFGDITYHQGELFAPLEGCDDYARIYVYDAQLNQRRFARLTSQRKTSWVAINPVTNHMYTSDNADGNDRLIYVYDRRFTNGEALTPLYTIVLDRPLRTIQGGVFSSAGHLYLTTSESPAGIHIFRIEGRVASRLRHIGPNGYKHGFPYYEEVEGITLWDLEGWNSASKGQIHWILLDNDASADEIYFKHISVDNSSRL